MPETSALVVVSQMIGNYPSDIMKILNAYYSWTQSDVLSSCNNIDALSIWQFSNICSLPQIGCVTVL